MRYVCPNCGAELEERASPATGGARSAEHPMEERASPATGGARSAQHPMEERASPATGGARSAQHSIVPQGRAPTKVYDLDELRSRLEEERKAAAAHAGQVWFAGVDGRSVGPLTLAGLQGLEARGQLRRGTLVWRGGWLAWIPAQSVPELRPLLGLPELAPSGDPPALPEEAGFAGDGRSPEGGA